MSQHPLSATSSVRNSELAQRPLVSLVVATRRRHAGLGRLLESLNPSTDERLRNVELVLIEDGPPYLLSVDWRGPLHHIWHATREGLAQCRNEGVAASSGDLIAFLDDDGVCGDGWLDAVLRVFEDPSARVVGGVILPSDGGRNLFSALRDQLYYRETFGIDYGITPAPGDTALRQVPYASGGNSVYRREIFDHYGLFDVDLPASIDTEWAARLRAGGETALLCRSMILIHDHPSTLKAFYARCWTAGVTRGRLARKGLHRTDEALDARRTGLQAAARLLWLNARRARNVTGHPRILVWLALQVQASTFLAGVLYGRFGRRR